MVFHRLEDVDRSLDVHGRPDGRICPHQRHLEGGKVNYVRLAGGRFTHLVGVGDVPLELLYFVQLTIVHQLPEPTVVLAQIEGADADAFLDQQPGGPRPDAPHGAGHEEVIAQADSSSRVSTPR